MEPEETTQPLDWNKPLQTVSGVDVINVRPVGSNDYRRGYIMPHAENPEGVRLNFTCEGICPCFPRYNLVNAPSEAPATDAYQEEAAESIDDLPPADDNPFGLGWLLGLHQSTCENAQATMRRKNHDYTNGSENVFANFEGAEFLNVDPVIGILIRTMDKFKRIETFVTQGKLEVAGEAVDDAIEDSINYLILAKAMIAQRGEGDDRSTRRSVKEIEVSPEEFRNLRIWFGPTVTVHGRPHDGKYQMSAMGYRYLTSDLLPA